MAYCAYFHDGIVELDPGNLGKHGPVIVGDLLAVWKTIGGGQVKYLIDGLEGAMTPVGTFGREIEAVTFYNDTLLIVSKQPEEPIDTPLLEAL